MPEKFNKFLTTRYEDLRLFWRLRDGTKLSDAKLVRFHLALFLGGGSYEDPQKIESVVFVFGARLCHEHKTSATTNNFFLAKKE
jgi:hypothetical protein